MERRTFLQAAIATGGAFAAAHWLQHHNAVFAAADDQEMRGDMPYRKLGATGEMVSLLGVGGYHIGVPEEEEGVRIIRTAIDNGVNFMDNSWDYHAGESERRMGRALKDGYRDKVFLMTKIDGRTKDSAAKQIDECLQRLDVDTVDLMQHHEIIRLEDADRIFAEGGAQEAVDEAVKAGKIRYVGFTGHKDPYVHNRMLDLAKQHGVPMHTVQMPLNLLDAHFRSFENEVLPRLVDENIGVLGMKSIASGALLETNTATAAECLRYAMSLKTDVVVAGMESIDRLNHHLEVVKNFKPLQKAEIEELLAKTKEPAMTGNYEKFKTTANFDATTHNPQWLG